MSTLMKSALSSPPMRWAVGGWSLFIAENLVLSENRTYIIRELGEDGYHYLYGFLSTTAVGSILYGYRYKVRGAGPFLWSPMNRAPPAAVGVSLVFQAFALGMASQAFPKLQIPVHLAGSDAHPLEEHPVDPSAELAARTWKVRCPFDFTDSKSQTGTDKSNPARNPDGTVELRGLDRVTRHPGLWSFGLLGLGNALLVPSVPTRVWMSMPLLMALVGGGHTDSRHRRSIGGSLCQDLDEATSNIPFWAMISGGQEGGNVTVAFLECAKEIKWLNASVAAALAAGWVLRRGRGGSPVPAAAFTR